MVQHWQQQYQWRRKDERMSEGDQHDGSEPSHIDVRNLLLDLVHMAVARQ